MRRITRIILSLLLLYIFVQGSYYILTQSQVLASSHRFRVFACKHLDGNQFLSTTIGRMALYPIDKSPSEWKSYRMETGYQNDPPMMWQWTGSRSVEESIDANAFIQRYKVSSFSYDNQDVGISIRIPPSEAFIEYQQFYDGEKMVNGTVKNLILKIDRKRMKGIVFCKFDYGESYHFTDYIAGQDFFLFRGVDPETEIVLSLKPSKWFEYKAYKMGVDKHLPTSDSLSWSRAFVLNKAL